MKIRTRFFWNSDHKNMFDHFAISIPIDRMNRMCDRDQVTKGCASDFLTFHNIMEKVVWNVIILDRIFTHVFKDFIFIIRRRPKYHIFMKIFYKTTASGIGDCLIYLMNKACFKKCWCSNDRDRNRNIDRNGRKDIINIWKII